MIATDLSFSNAVARAFERTVGRVAQYMHKAKIDTSESTPNQKAEQRNVGRWRLEARLVSQCKRHGAHTTPWHHGTYGGAQ